MNFIRLVMYECLYFTNLRNMMYIYLLLFQPVVYLTVVKFMLMLRESNGDERFVLAIGIMSAWSYVLYSSGSSLIAEKWMGTLELVMNSRTSLFQIILSKAISNACIGTLSIFITLLYAKFLFQFSLSFSVVSTLICILGLIFSLMSMGILLAIIFSMFQSVYAYQNLILFPMLIVGGVFYPVHLMPQVVQTIAAFVPMRWMVDALYQTVQQNQLQVGALSIGLLVSCLYLMISYGLLKRFSQNMKENSVMGVF
jgi:ABC-2 type transport system permease protein